MKYLVKHTKIVSTFGPSVTFDLKSSDDFNCPARKELFDKSFEIVKKLILSGVNCIRFNFSHGKIDENSARISVINAVQRSFIDDQLNEKRQYFRPVVFLADTKGPEIRVYDMGSDGVSYSIGQEITIYCKEQRKGDCSGFSVVDVSGTYNMANDCVVGNYVLVEDGKLTLQITDVDKDKGLVKVIVKNTHKIKTNKRINLPGADYSMDFLSNKDKEDIKYSIDNGFEYLALSFVNSADNVNEVRNFVKGYCKEKGIPNIIQIYSKTETQKSCDNLSEITSASDGIMIARGDLGLEIPYYKVPYWTKEMIRECRNQIKPVITATQMLDSLERNVVATRAEVSDVYRAAELGSDCTMLSGETAQGMFPILSVETMSNIVYESERNFDAKKYISFFKQGVVLGLSEEIRKLCECLLNSIKDHDAIVLNYDSVSLDVLKAISNMRLNLPMFVFVNCKDVKDYCSEPKWESEDYVKMKEAAGLMLYRSINLIFVSGESADLSTMFSEYLSRYLGCSCAFKNVFLWECK